jgi:predicted nucleotidyltransferase
MFLYCKHNVLIMCTLKLFSSAEKLRVLEELLFGNEEKIRVRNLARTTEVSPSLVSNTVSELKKSGMINENKVGFLHPSVKATKILLNIRKINAIKLIAKAKKLFKNCKGIGLYGSWAKGTNTRDSDLDMWIIAEKEDDKNKTELRRLVKQKLETEINIIVLTQKRLNELREKDFVFYSALHHSFVLWGDGI